MQDIEHAIDEGPPLDQQLLSDLSKRPLKQHLHGDPEAYNHIQALWDCLVQSALTRNFTEKYLTAACNCIAVFLSSAASSPFDSVRQFSFSRQVWFAAFECAQNAFHHGKTKPALQVLETLAQLLKGNSDETTASEIQSECCQRLLNVILTGQPSHQLKSACMALSCLAKKTTLLPNLEDVLARSLAQINIAWQQYQLQHSVFIGRLANQSSNSPHLFLALLFAVQNLDTRSAALKFFGLLVKAENWTRERSPNGVAAETIELFIKQNASVLGDFADNILPVILDDRPRYQAFVSFYKPDSNFAETGLILYLSVLRIGRLNRFLTEDDLQTTLHRAFMLSRDPQQCSDHFDCVRLLLRSASPSIRIHTYKLLTTSFGTTAVVPDGILRCIIACMRHLHDDNDAHERGEILTITRRLINRLESSIASLKKNNAFQLSLEPTAILRYYNSFILQLGSFLLCELDPGISYQRHILALQSLRILIKSPRLATWEDFSPFVEPLASLMLDPFEDVRSASALMLNDMCELSPDAFRNFLPLRLVHRVTELSARTCRHDHADAAGRLFAFLLHWQDCNAGNRDLLQGHASFGETVQSLNDHLSSSDPIKPGSSFALHALLSALTHSLVGGNHETIHGDLYSDLVELCQHIWSSVQNQLCVDSPERDEDIEDDGSLGPKDLLSCSWRALRDSSLLLQAIIRTVQYDHDILSRIGWLCMEQLTLLRHRGAFSTVAQTFSLCCDSARQAQNPASKQLNETWCRSSLEEIEKQATKLTRRSAGLPAMICAVVSPEDPKRFADVYYILKAKAIQPVLVNGSDRNGPSLPQVHALNCLKDLMMHSKFRTVTERYVSELLEVASASMASPMWAIRNCGLMLLRACMNRLDQQRPESSTLQLDLNRFESSKGQPLDVVLTLLDSKLRNVEDPALRMETVFAGLDLAKIVGPFEGDSERLNSLVYKQLENPVWAIRERAARLLADRELVHGIDDQVFTKYLPPTDCSDNMLHGTLLFFRCIFEDLSHRVELEDETKPGLVQRAMSIMTGISARFEDDYSPYTKAALFDILNLVFVHTLASGELLGWPKEMIHSFQRKIADADVTAHQFYHSKVLLCRVLIFLLGSQFYPDQIQSVDEDIVHELARDPDTARLVIHKIEKIRTPLIPALIGLLVGLIGIAQATEIQGLSMMTLAEYIEANHETLSDQQALSLQIMINNHKSWELGLWHAFVRLEACLIRRHLLQRSDGMSGPLLARMRSWLFMVQAAGKGQLDFSTRLNAAVALRYCGRCLIIRLAQGQSLEREELWMDVLLILYDQLNDDDDEVRKVAEQTAASISQECQSWYKTSVILCASAARYSILNFLIERFSHMPKLTMLALERLLGLANGEVPKPLFSSQLGIGESVSTRLHHVRATLHDLFAEEKQNLYVDDVDDNVQWSRVLLHCDLKCLGEERYTAIMDWCSEGLDALRLLIRSSNHSNGGQQHGDQFLFHPISPTHNPDILVIFIRVIKLAKVLNVMHEEDDVTNTMELDETGRVQGLRQKVTDLRLACLEASAHRRVLNELDVTPGSEQR